MGKAAVVDGRMYVMGGETRRSASSSVGITKTKVYSRVDVLDLGSGKWSRGAPLPVSSCRGLKRTLCWASALAARALAGTL